MDDMTKFSDHIKNISEIAFESIESLSTLSGDRALASAARLVPELFFFLASRASQLDELELRKRVKHALLLKDHLLDELMEGMMPELKEYHAVLNERSDEDRSSVSLSTFVN